MLAIRFAMNWHLVASNLRDANKLLSRSAEECRERWYLLAKSNPALYNEMREGRQADASGASLKRPTDTRGTKQKSIVYRRISQDNDTPMETDEEEQDNIPTPLLPKRAALNACLAPDIITQHTANAPGGEPKKRRSFSVFRAASLKRQDVPMPIPGIVAGQKPSLSTPHPSHQQSLQAAVAVLSTGGRTEMWPLQILDLADKQKKASLSSSASRPSNSQHISSGSYQATQSRHAPVQQQYVPPANQPVVPKVGIPPQPQSTSGK